VQVDRQTLADGEVGQRALEVERRAGVAPLGGGAAIVRKDGDPAEQSCGPTPRLSSLVGSDG